MTERHLSTIQVAGPASFATAQEKRRKDAVRSAVATARIRPRDARFTAGMEFRVAVSGNVNKVRDFDNLIRPTLTQIEGVFGARSRKGLAQAADDRVDHLEAVKRLARAGKSRRDYRRLGHPSGLMGHKERILSCRRQCRVRARPDLGHDA
jgi:hypothetical protein